MILLVLALLAAPPASLPDGKAFDTLRFSFHNGVPGLGPGGHLSITADGKLHYQYVSAPHTGSGGHVVDTKWEIPKAEVEKLFRDLVEHGLLDLPEGVAFGTNTFFISSGRWGMALTANPVPEKILADLRPYLGKADRNFWKEKPLAKSKPVPTRLDYTFTEKDGAPQIALAITREGNVIYSRYDHTAPEGKRLLVNESWSIKPGEAETLLDALIACGLLGAADTGGGKFPDHFVQIQAGKWRTALHPKELPDAAMKLLRPLLEKADPEVWKKK